MDSISVFALKTIHVQSCIGGALLKYHLSCPENENTEKIVKVARGSCVIVDSIARGVIENKYRADILMKDLEYCLFLIQTFHQELSFTSGAAPEASEIHALMDDIRHFMASTGE